MRDAAGQLLTRRAAGGEGDRVQITVQIVVLPERAA
jgi:hypothetical protein